MNAESFSKETKNELCQIRVKMRCCRISTLCGILFGFSECSLSRIAHEFDNFGVLRYYTRLMREFLPFDNLSDASLCCLDDQEKTQQVFSLFHQSGKKFGIPDEGVFCCEFCPWQFLRGVFLVCGTVTEPDSAYHLEFLMPGVSSADALCRFFEPLGYHPGVIQRHGKQVGVYFKDSESVVDILGHLGASQAAFRLLDVKIFRDLRNNVNRAANCEVANLRKTLSAAIQQKDAIQKIIETNRFDLLPDELKETLNIRVVHPDATLSELAELHQPPITKSGVNHRLKRLVLFAEQTGKEKE